MGLPRLKIVVFGSREAKISRPEFERTLDVEIEKILVPTSFVKIEIISGGAVGIDTMAKKYAESRGIDFKEFLPDYDKYGRIAPLRRNQEMAEYADAGIGFSIGNSPGTHHMVQEAIKKQLNPVVLFNMVQTPTRTEITPFDLTKNASNVILW